MKNVYGGRRRKWNPTSQALLFIINSSLIIINSPLIIINSPLKSGDDETRTRNLRIDNPLPDRWASPPYVPLVI